MIRFYVALAVFIVMLGGTIYGVILYKDKEFQDEKIIYQNEINTLKSEKNKLIVDKKETKSKRDFINKKKKIVKKSNETKAHTKKMMEKKDVKEFTDSF
jgi:uncharacterized membrane protein YgaE (UPF0421/DUF939 family)